MKIYEDFKLYETLWDDQPSYRLSYRSSTPREANLKISLIYKLVSLGESKVAEELNCYEIRITDKVRLPEFNKDTHIITISDKLAHAIETDSTGCDQFIELIIADFNNKIKNYNKRQPK